MSQLMDALGGRAGMTLVKQSTSTVKLKPLLPYEPTEKVFPTPFLLLTWTLFMMILLAKLSLKENIGR